jgi:hypothetical protein
VVNAAESPPAATCRVKMKSLTPSYNIDVAPRVAGLKEGDGLRFDGEYAWNEDGGVVHWTHRDPEGRHVAGRLKHNGRTSQ